MADDGDMEMQDASSKTTTRKVTPKLNAKQRQRAARYLANKHGVGQFMLDNYLSDMHESDIQSIVVLDPEHVERFYDQKDNVGTRESVMRQIITELGGGHKAASKISVEQDEIRVARIHKRLLVFAQHGDPALGWWEVGVTVAPRGEDVTSPKYFRSIAPRLRQDLMLRNVYDRYMSFKTDTGSGDRRSCVGSLRLNDPDNPGEMLDTVYYDARAIANGIFTKLIAEAREEGILDSIINDPANDPGPDTNDNENGDGKPVKVKKPRKPRKSAAIVADGDQVPVRASLPTKKTATVEQARVGTPVEPPTPEQDATVPKKRGPRGPNKGKKYGKVVQIDEAIERRNQGRQRLAFYESNTNQSYFIKNPSVPSDTTKRLSFFPKDFSLDAPQAEKDIIQFKHDNIDSLMLIKVFFIHDHPLEFMAHAVLEYMEREEVPLQSATVDHVNSLFRDENFAGRRTVLDVAIQLGTHKTVIDVLVAEMPKITGPSRPLLSLSAAADQVHWIREETYQSLSDRPMPQKCLLSGVAFNDGDECYGLCVQVGDDHYYGLVHREVSYDMCVESAADDANNHAPEEWSTDAAYSFNLASATGRKQEPRKKTSRKRASEVVNTEDNVTDAMEGVTPTTPVVEKTSKPRKPKEDNPPKVVSTPPASKPQPIPVRPVASAPVSIKPARRPEWVLSTLDKSETKSFWAYTPDAWKLKGNDDALHPLVINGDADFLSLCRSAFAQPADAYDKAITSVLSTNLDANAYITAVSAAVPTLPVQDKGWIGPFAVVLLQFVKPLPDGDAVAFAASIGGNPPTEVDPNDNFDDRPAPFTVTFMPNTDKSRSSGDVYRGLAWLYAMANKNIAVAFRDKFKVVPDRPFLPVQLAAARVLFGDLARARAPATS